MSSLNPRPIIFALSNPVRLSEATFADAVTHSSGRVIYASGSPFAPVPWSGGQTLIPGQGNNMYVFPGLGLGAILARAKHVTDGMVEAAAFALAESLTQGEKDEGRIYPRVERIREISAKVAVAVIRAARKSVS
jgi:malate dehydrogenase (oxaloacetate-decarboxylating)(NADP+)